MNNNELQHYGVVGMRWGKRKAKQAELRNYKQAANAFGDKRRQEFLKKAKEHRKEAEEYDRQIKEHYENKNKSSKTKMSRGKKIAIAALSGFGVGLVIDVTKNRETYAMGMECTKALMSWKVNDLLNK